MRGFSSKEKVTREDKASFNLYCLLSGVYTQVVYEQTESDGQDYYKAVRVTDPSKLSKQKALSAANVEQGRAVEYVTTTTTKPTGVVTTTETVNIDPVAIFNYSNGVTSASYLISDWKSSYSTPNLRQSTTANKPLLGRRKGGVEGNVALYFDGARTVSSAAHYMTFDTEITLSGDFTIFAYVTPVSHKYISILGKAADANMYMQCQGLNQLEFGLGSGKTVAIDISSSPLAVDTGVLLTVQRSGTTLYVRKDGVAIGSATVVTDDFVFDQFGRVGTSAYTLPAYAHNLSIYNGYIITTLTEKESAIMKDASGAQLV